MNKDRVSWLRVVPAAVVEGSKAQVRNVLDMALEDIESLYSEAAFSRLKPEPERKRVRSKIIEEGDRQLLLLALAHLAVERPGFDYALNLLALRFEPGEGGRATMYDRFRELAEQPAPIPMILHCPFCRTQHIDAPEPENGWENPPHRSHKCAACRMVWRPADVPTTGVEAIATRGSADNAAIDSALIPGC